MKKTLIFLAATTALTAAIGIPAWSAMRASGDEDARPFTALLEEGAAALPLMLASDDDGEHRYRKNSQGRHDEDEGDDEDDDDGDSRGGVRNPAPAGTAMPPQNGLFEKGAPPRVLVK